MQYKKKYEVKINKFHQVNPHESSTRNIVMRDTRKGELIKKGEMMKKLFVFMTKSKSLQPEQK